jgi:hypothetical protein
MTVRLSSDDHRLGFVPAFHDLAVAKASDDEGGQVQMDPLRPRSALALSACGGCSPVSDILPRGFLNGRFNPLFEP